MAYQAQFNGVGVGSSFSGAIQLVAVYGQFGVTSLVTGVDVDIDGENPAHTTRGFRLWSGPLRG